MAKTNKKALEMKKAAAEEEKRKALKRKLEEEMQEEEEEEDDTDEEVESEDVEDEDLDDEEVDDEEVDDEDEDDEEEDEEEEENDNKELLKDDGSEKAEFDFEAFPLEDGDKDGLVNMLTQIFLRTDVDVVGLAEEMIKISPFGNVIGPAEDQSDEDSENVVYGVVSAVDLDLRKEEPAKFAKSVVDFVVARAKKHALKDIVDQFEKLESSRTGFLINERMLHFPNQIVSPSFNSLNIDIAGMKKPFKKVMYIQKIRVADLEEGASSSTTSVPAKKKKKLGKAAKKRLAAESLSQREVMFDNKEDADLYKLKEGSLHHFDYPVHNDVEADSKFHIIEKNNKKYRPYRRAIIMDAARFNAFVKHLASTSYE